MREKKKLSSNKYLNNIVLALLTTFVFTVNMNADLSTIEPTKSSVVLINIILDFLIKVKAIFGDYSFQDIFIFASALFFFWNTDIKKTTKKACVIVPTILFTFFMVLGYSYKMTDSWQLVFGSWFHVMMSFILILGYFYLIKRIIECIYAFYDDFNWTAIKLRPKFIEKHTLLSTWFIILLAWIPYIVLRFPGMADYSTKYEIQQFFGELSFNGHHPPFHAMILGSCVWIGKQFGSNNFGLFIYTFLQCLIFTFALAYSLYSMKKWKCPTVFRTIAFMIYAFLPIYPMWGTTALKDSMYAPIFIIYILLLIELIREKYLSNRKMILFSIIMLLVMLLRNNGAYLVIPTSVILVIYQLKNGKDITRESKSASKKNNLKIVCCTVIPFILFLGFNKLLMPVLGIEEGSIKEALSIPFQQTARYVSEYKDEVTTSEAEAIAAILDYENMVEDYNPNLSDPVKDAFKLDATKAELNAYFKVWLQQLLKHPGVYVEATINTNYGFFYPGLESHGWYTMVENYYNTGDYVFNRPSILKNLSDVLTDIIMVLDKVPLYNILENAAFYTWLLILVLCLFIRSKKSKYIIVTIPLLMNLLVCIAGPAYLGNERYAFPITFVVPILIGLVLSFQTEPNNKLLHGEK